MKQLFALFILLNSFSCLNAQQLMNKELSLSEAVKTGLEKNPQIKSAKENLISAEGRFWNGISLPSPEVNVSYEYAPINSSINNFSERTFEVSQSFEFPSNYFLRGNRLSKEEEIAFILLNQTELKLRTQIKSAYYNALVKEELLNISEENLFIAEEFSKKAEIKYNVGEGTSLEKLTAKVQLTEAVIKSEAAKNELKTALAELSYVIGYGKTAEINLVLTDSLFFDLSDKNLITVEELYDMSLSSNQQIRISELNLGALSIDKSLAWSSLLPEFNLSYFRQTRDGDNGFYGASFGMSVPLWFMFENRGKIQEATANVNIAEAELQSLKNEIYLRLKSSFYNYENNLKQVKLYLNDILPQAEEVYRTASASYYAGEITYLEYLQARQILIDAKHNYTNILFSYNHSLLTLEETTGKNFTDKNDGDSK